MDPEQLSPTAKKFFERVEFDTNEKIIREVLKDPIGLVMIYAGGFLATIALFSLMVLGGSAYDFSSISEASGMSQSGLRALLVGAGFFLTVFSIIITAVAAFLYSNNVVIITSEKISQQLYLSLFNKKISQLSIADVQDVTVKQQGILAHIFNYGTVTIETAGEQSNYTFTFTPEPYEMAKDLVGSHEADAAIHGN